MMYRLLSVVKRHPLITFFVLAYALSYGFVPISFAALGFVFWKRSIVYGLVLMNAVVLAKLVWSFYFGDASGGLTLLPSALAGLAVCDAVILYVVHRIRKGSSQGSSSKPPQQVSQHGG